MSLRYVAPLAMAAAAAAIGLAPVAAAAPSGPIDQCTGTANSTVCQRPGHVGIVSSPPVVSPPAVPVSPISVGPDALRERLTPVASSDPAPLRRRRLRSSPQSSSAEIHAAGEVKQGRGADAVGADRFPAIASSARARRPHR